MLINVLGDDAGVERVGEVRVYGRVLHHPCQFLSDRMGGKLHTPSTARPDGAERQGQRREREFYCVWAPAGGSEGCLVVSSISHGIYAAGQGSSCNEQARSISIGRSFTYTLAVGRKAVLDRSCLAGPPAVELVTGSSAVSSGRRPGKRAEQHDLEWARLRKS